MTLDMNAIGGKIDGMAKVDHVFITRIAPAHQAWLSLPKVTVTDELVLFKVME